MHEPLPQALSTTSTRATAPVGFPAAPPAPLFNDPPPAPGGVASLPDLSAKAAGAVLGRPELVTWSHSRDRMLQRCRRQYALTYVLSQGGWRQDSPAHVAEAYRLKNLRSLSAEVGSAVHRRAQDCVRAILAGDPLPSFASLLAPSREELNALAKSSKLLAEFKAAPNRVGMLREVYYDDELQLRTAFVERATATLRTALENLVVCPLWEELRAIPNPRHNILLPDPFYLFEVMGHRLYAAPDLVYRCGDDWRVVDWKTGHVGNDGEVDQVSVYGLAVVEGFGWPLTPGCAGRIINLVRGEDDLIALSADDLADARRRMVEGAAAMRRLVSEDDGTPRQVTADDFATTRRERDCMSCVFKAACHPAVADALARRDALHERRPATDAGAAEQDAA